MFKLLMGSVLVLLLAATSYTWSALHLSYSDGQRAGYVQKLARKGWLCKTWEGEMLMASVPGTRGARFAFTVADDGVAAGLNATMGQPMALHYKQHKGVPTSCFGDSEYFVIGARPVAPLESP